MPFPTIPLPSVWDIPVAAGVPALLGQSIGAGVSASASTLLGKAVSNIQTGLAAQEWGIFSGADSVLTAAHVCGIEHEQRYQISTAPTENGGFVSYNKAKFPHLTRILMVCDGSESGSLFSIGFKQVLGSIRGSQPLAVRKSFFDTLESLVADTKLYNIHMPERFYMNANVVAYRFRRDERNGVTMPVVEIELQEVRNTAVNAYSDPLTRAVSASTAVQAGEVQVQKLPSGAPDLTGGLLTGGQVMAGIIPLSAAKSQSLNVTLSGQTIRLDIAQKRTGLFLNVWQSGALVVSNAICLTNTFIVRAPYLGLPGDFAFFDMQGNDDPDYTGLGSRWLLYYSGA